MKTKILQLLSQFARITLAFIPVLFLFRLAEAIYLSSVHILPLMIWTLQFRGFLFDLLLLACFALVLFIPYLLISLLHPGTGKIFYITVFTLLMLINALSIGYFSITLVPLDHVVFTYTLKEMWLIALSSVQLSFLHFLIPIGLILIIIACQYLFRKLPVPKIFLICFFAVLLGPAIGFHKLSPEVTNYSRDIDYYLVTNKSYYFFERCFVNYRYFRDLADLDTTIRSTDLSTSVMEAAARWHKAQPGFRFLGNQYPFLHTDLTPDQLGGFFNFKAQKPNFVFLIVESLSSVFCGDDPAYGSFTPFLDSLIGKSLYWKNFVSSSERTFNVLPALLGSMPPGKGATFQNLSKCPLQLSLIRYLKEDGYYSEFFYGGDPAFNDMENYCKRQQVDYVLKSFGPDYQRMTVDNPGYKWGYSDEDLFRRSFEVMDSANKNPRLDIYLTLTMHSPFIPPDAEHFRKKARERMVELGFSKERIKTSLTYENICSAILYTDNALRKFFHEYSKRKEFENTIFIITGDHALPELNVAYISNLERFHVPLIIYSPLLKKAENMKSVSSHLDVAPSILAMMKKQFQTRLLPEAHWLGTGIDTCRTFRNIHSFAMIRNNRDIIDYIRGEYYLCEDRLYHLLPDLRIKEIGNKAMLSKMMQELDDFKTLNSYVIQKNRLLPMNLFYPEDMKQELLVSMNSVPLDLSDSVSEFHTIFKNLKLEHNFKYLDVALDFSFRSKKKEAANLPAIILTVLNSGEQPLVWHSVGFYETNDPDYHPGAWNQVSIRRSFDLSICPDVKGQHINSYFWNWNKGIVRFRDAKITITGYY